MASPSGRRSPAGAEPLSSATRSNESTLPVSDFTDVPNFGEVEGRVWMLPPNELAANSEEAFPYSPLAGLTPARGAHRTASGWLESWHVTEEEGRVVNGDGHRPGESRSDRQSEHDEHKQHEGTGHTDDGRQ